jgi:Phosphotransferase enzyme family
MSWVDDRLAGDGRTRTGEPDQPHLRPWATALKIPTDRGPVWLKAAGPGTAFEVGLYELLQRVVPDRILTPLGIDVARGWILLPDGGETLGDRLSGDDLATALVRFMPQYAQLQRDLAPHAGDLLALGVADMRPAAMPARFDEAVAAVARYVERTGDPADHAAYQRGAGLAGAFPEWCARLAGAPGPSSLDHNDLHPWNTFVNGVAGGDDRPRFYDWGDSVVAHPFASMLVGLGFLRHHLGAGDEDSRLLRVRDAYLEPFTGLAPRAELVETLELACRVAKVARALTWDRAVRALAGAEDSGDFASAPLRCLESLADESYLGGA